MLAFFVLRLSLLSSICSPCFTLFVFLLIGSEGGSRFQYVASNLPENTVTIRSFSAIIEALGTRTSEDMQKCRWGTIYEMSDGADEQVTAKTRPDASLHVMVGKRKYTLMRSECWVGPMDTNLNVESFEDELRCGWGGSLFSFSSFISVAVISRPCFVRSPADGSFSRTTRQSENRSWEWKMVWLNGVGGMLWMVWRTWR